ncbi:dethiobiotin synthase [Pontibacterium sp. N1Y112]|uniref:ATP-dependent dethiobiotin synthetase BioD n=1 Tax=Pontibacterium sinense TaxID=2781979 RepID=A0A8J7JYI0_9GAMM|nr:dethiobiotin synthase [Pontibacterium sinense]MBE9396494.1 dethiobiotin synthase [Pontibacterium sinense]
MAKRSFFITGTDTDAGKTIVTAGLLAAANKAGKRTIGLKPVAAGCEDTPEGLRNSDAVLLQETASVKLSYDQVNPIAFAPAIAPHIAAMREGRMMSGDRIAAYCRGAMMQPADLVLVEGAGGWRVPLSYRETMAQIPKSLQVPVILVVGMKLGCINHALMSAESISRDGIPLAGWIANRVDADMECYEENRDTIANMLRAPMLAEIPHVTEPTPDNIAEFIDIDRLFSG